MVDVEASACCIPGHHSDIGNRYLCLQLDLDRLQRQRYRLGLYAVASSPNCTGDCANLVHGRGSATARLVVTVEIGDCGTRGASGHIIHRNLRFQLDLDRLQGPRARLGLAEPTVGTSDCGCIADMVQYTSGFQ